MDKKDFDELVKKYKKRYTIKSKGGLATIISLVSLLAIGGGLAAGHFGYVAAHHHEDSPILPESKCLVTFDTDGGSEVKYAVVEKGKTVTQPEDPTRDNSIFKGWYKDKDLKYPFDFESPIKEHTVVYAGYELKESYDGLSFEPKYGDVEVEVYVKPEDKSRVPEYFKIPSTWTDPETKKEYKVTGIYNNFVTLEEGFADCLNLKEIEVPFTTSLTNGAFKGCSQLRRITLKPSLSKIESDCFNGCSSLEKIDLPNIWQMGDRAFKDCTSLTSLSLNVQGNVSNVTFGSECFSGCINLSEIVCGSNIDCICSYAFKNCYSLKNIILPKQISYIDDGAFYGCYNLESFDYEDEDGALTYIGNEAFYNCIKLKEIEISNNVVFIGSKAFDGCDSLTKVTFKNTENWQQCTKEGDIVVTNPENNATYLKNVDSTTDNNWGYTGIKDKNVSPTYYLTYTILDQTLKTSEVQVKPNCTITNISVDEKDPVHEGFKVTKVSGNAYINDALVDITLPATVTEIGTGAFDCYYQLTKVTLDGTPALKTIGSFAFESSALTEFWFPESVKTVENRAFNVRSSNPNYYIDSTAVANFTSNESYIFNSDNIYTKTNINVESSSYLYQHFSQGPKTAEGYYKWDRKK